MAQFTNARKQEGSISLEGFTEEKKLKFNIKENSFLFAWEKKI